MHHSGPLLIKVDFHKKLLRFSGSNTVDTSIFYSPLQFSSPEKEV